MKKQKMKKEFWLQKGTYIILYVVGDKIYHMSFWSLKFKIKKDWKMPDEKYYHKLPYESAIEIFKELKFVRKNY